MHDDETLDDAKRVAPRKPGAVCGVDRRPDGTRTVYPCRDLFGLLMANADGGMAGAHLMAFGTMARMSHLLVIQPRRGTGRGQIAKFCPCCGTSLQAGKRGVGKKRPPLMPRDGAARDRLENYRD